MGLGYQGYATINGSQFLVTSLSAPFTQTRLDSSAGWGGSITSTRTGIGAPRTYDFSGHDGSIGYELSVGLGSILRNLINGRSSPFSLFFQPCSGASVTINEAWWTSISLTGSEGSAVTGDISFTAVEHNSQIFGSQYITNREGDRACAAFNDIPPLNPSAMNISPVPFWKTTFSGGPISGVEVTTWTASFSQDVQKMFQCGATGRDPQAPILLGFGPMNVELQLELFVRPGNTWGWTREPGAVTIALGEGSSMTFSQLENQSVGQDIAGQNEVANIAVTYQVYNLAA